MDTPSALSILILVALLQVKHALVDGPLQRRWMVADKGAYGRPGGLVHAALQGAGSLAALVVFGVGAMPSLLLAAADAVVHYHIDYTKEKLVRGKGWTTSQPHFWWVFMADQLAHHLCYLAIAAAVATWP
jgi:hypothetical protein